MKNIVLCGSMKVKDKMLDVKDRLEKIGFNVLLPKECMEGLPKEIASRKHFERIIDKANEYILVINVKKDGKDNYIGPNSLAEIAFSFYFNKKIYLLNDIYEPYSDELRGWKVIELHGNLERLKDE